MTIVFFDTETTGLPRDYNAPSSKLDNWPRLVQLAWIVSDYDGNVISSEDHIIIPDGFEIPSISAAIHGITTSIAKSKGEKLINVIDNFLGVLQNATAIAGHNISFDQHIVEAEILRCGRSNILKNIPSYCTMKLSANYCNILNSNKEVKWPTLQELYYKLYREKFENSHNAIADVKATYRCFFSLVKLGVIKLEDECVDSYRGWRVTNKRPFTDEEIKVVKEAFVIQTKAGYSVKFIFNDWKETYIPVDEKSNVSICEIIDLENAMILTLSKPGHDDIYRVQPKQGDAKSTKYDTSHLDRSDDNGGFSHDGYIMLRYYDALDVEEYKIPEGCKVLADSCFSLEDPYEAWENPHFSSLIIPDSLEIIGDYAFGGCAELESLHIPASVKHIQGNPFPSMLPITIDSPLYVVKDDILYDKDYTRLIHAFSLSKTIIIDPSVRKIEHSAFSGSNNLSNIVVHSEISEIGEYVFSYCQNLKNVIINAKMESIPNSLFRASGIYEFDIPTETKKIGLASFKDCKRLQKVDIPENVTEIDAFAFENDESLKYVTINADIQTIEQGTFRGCSSLKEIVIPEGVKSIRKEVFKDCTSLENIRLPYSLEELGDAVFEGCTNLKRIELPRGIKELSRKMFHGCKTLREVVMSSTIEYIGSEVFEGCDSLYSIVIPVGVKGIGSDAFSYSGLREVIIPDTVTELGEATFCECRNLHSAFIPGSIKTIPKFCFHGCRSLSQITICEGVESIEDAAFRVCPSLKKLLLPEGMKKFGDAFTLEYSLINDLYVPSTLEDIVPFNRGYDSGYVNLHVPFGMKTVAEKYIEDTKKRLEEHGYDFDEPFEIFEYAVIDNLIVEVQDKSKNTLTVKGFFNPYVSHNVVIPSSALFKGKYYRITRIETNAFYNVMTLNSIKISDGITSIGAHAFSYCSSLNKIEFPASLTNIEGELFYGCYNLESIFVDFDNPKFLSVNGVLYSKDHKKIVAYPNANGKDYKIIDGTEYIENFAFKSCIDLENLRLPQSIRVIGDNVFYGCDKLKKVCIPNDLEKIGILQERTNTVFKYKDDDYTITQLVNLICKR